MAAAPACSPTHPAPAVQSAWRRATPAAPCPVCGKPDWCSVSADCATAHCRRVSAGGLRRVDRAGVEFWVHRLAPALRQGPAAGAHTPPAAPWEPPPAAAPDLLDRAYRAALAALPLSAAHREALRRRGLPDAEVRLRGYATLTDALVARAGAAALGAVGPAVLARVPGFRRAQAGGDARLAAPPGQLVPVRDVGGRIVALKVRRDDDVGGPRYVYASSARWGGPGPGAPAHLPRLTAPPLPPPVPGVMRVTEGELKADVASVLSRIRTLSVAGVGAWRSALPVLRELGAQRILLAFDADARRKPAVARALYALALALQGEPGVDVAMEQWDEADGKGIDDLLARGGRPQVVEGADVLRRLEDLLPGGPGDAAAVASLTGGSAALAPLPPREAADAFRAKAIPVRTVLRLAEGSDREFVGGMVAACRSGVDPRALLTLSIERAALRGAGEAAARGLVDWAISVARGDLDVAAGC